MDAANSRVGSSCCFKEGMFIASVDKPWKRQFQADAILRLYARQLVNITNADGNTT